MQTKNCPNNGSTIQSYLKFIAMLLAIWLLAFPAASAPKEAATQEDLSSQKEIFQLKLDARNDKIEALNKRLDDQIARTSDIGSGVDRLSVSITAFGVLITVVLFFGGLTGYFSTVTRARREAQEASKKWFDDNAVQLKAQIIGMEQDVVASKQAINTAVTQVQLHEGEAHALISDSLNHAQLSLAAGRVVNLSDQNIIAAQAVVLQGKAESSYSFMDWNTRAFAALDNKKLEEAIFYWDKAASVINAGAENAAKAMVNKGVALGQLNRSEDAIVVYDSLIAQYSADPAPALREQVAYALSNKGFAKLLQAKQRWVNTEQRLNALNVAKQCFSEALERRSNHALMLSNSAYCAWLSGDSSYSETQYANALRVADGGEALYKATLGDLAIHPVDVDAGFNELIERLWRDFQQLNA